MSIKSDKYIYLVHNSFYVHCLLFIQVCHNIYKQNGINNCTNTAEVVILDTQDKCSISFEWPACNICRNLRYIVKH